MKFDHDDPIPMLPIRIAASMAIVLSAGCAASPVEENVASTVITFDEFRQMVYQEPDTGVFIVNGDTPIESERELEQFYVEFVRAGALILHRPFGVDARWNETQKLNLTYCVSTTFNSNYNAVVNAMNAAAGAWEAAANVNLIHVGSQDTNCTASNSNVMFDVRPVSGRSYLARAFFPNTSRSARNVLIDASSFGNIAPWTLAGILRHELGHALGFRHEHTRPEAGTCFEDTDWRALTTYDAASVMHYPQCNGTQTSDLLLTLRDKEGVASVYGFPGGSTCAHDKCTVGTSLNPNVCGACVQSICSFDPYCCNTQWDEVCVGYVLSVCGDGGCNAAAP